MLRPRLVRDGGATSMQSVTYLDALTCRVILFKHIYICDCDKGSYINLSVE